MILPISEDHNEESASSEPETFIDDSTVQKQSPFHNQRDNYDSEEEYFKPINPINRKDVKLSELIKCLEHKLKMKKENNQLKLNYLQRYVSDKNKKEPYLPPNLTADMKCYFSKFSQPEYRYKIYTYSPFSGEIKFMKFIANANMQYERMKLVMNSNRLNPSRAFDLKFTPQELQDLPPDFISIEDS
jgi:hypothetical protein